MKVLFYTLVLKASKYSSTEYTKLIFSMTTGSFSFFVFSLRIGWKKLMISSFVVFLGMFFMTIEYEEGSKKEILKSMILLAIYLFMMSTAIIRIKAASRSYHSLLNYAYSFLESIITMYPKNLTQSVSHSQLAMRTRSDPPNMNSNEISMQKYTVILKKRGYALPRKSRS